MVKILTTLPNSVGFDVFDTDRQGNLTRNLKKRIRIGGGAGVFDGVYVPKGVSTVITDNQYEQLRKHPTFNAFVANGSIIAVKTDEKKPEIQEKEIVADLNQKDNSNQRTPSDIGVKNVVNCDKNGNIIVEVEEDEKPVEVTSAKKPTKKSTKIK